MNRKGLKAAARQSLQDVSGLKGITLLFLLGILALGAMDWGVGALAERSAGGGKYLSQLISAQTRAYLITVVSSLVFQLLLVLWLMGYASLSLKLSRREEISRDTLLDGFRSWGKGILLYLWTSLFLSLWGSALSMPASYLFSYLYLLGEMSLESAMNALTVTMAAAMAVMSYRYRMAWYVFFDRPELSFRQVLSAAKALMRGHRWELFRLDLSFLPWMLVCVLTAGIAGIWRFSYITATYAHAYNSMLTQYDEEQRRIAAMLREQNWTV